MNLYLDASALVKRYIAESGSDAVRGLMGRADKWFMCRIGFVETVRAVGLSGGPPAVQIVEQEWSSFDVVEVDQRLVEEASDLALKRGLRSLDALHLAAALTLPHEDFALVTWDHRLHAAARLAGLQVLPAELGDHG